ncbi:MAG: HD domain-containing protein [Janthinobacterium lividum]
MRRWRSCPSWRRASPRSPTRCGGDRTYCSEAALTDGDPIGPDPIGGPLLAHIRALHAGPTRAYHGWSHIEALLALSHEVRGELHDPLAVRAAILLHDAVYDAHADDNEARSAALAAELLGGLLPPATLARTVRLIEATAAHAIPPGLDADEAADTARFLDMDLSILGAPEATFDCYEAGVRAEYAHVAEPAFRAGRMAILERFLARDPLFLSAWGRRRFEAAARANLRRSLDALRRHQ